MNIRPAVIADVPAMLELERRAATAAHWKKQDYQRLFQPGGRRLALVLEEEGKVCGFVVGRELGEEWEIENVAVAGPARRRGLGTRLVGELLDHARVWGAHSVYLEVRESNRAARALYEKWAFVESGRRRSYYHDPEEDALVYRLTFPQAAKIPVEA
ncbi:MAG TPA: ribosomal protein S18-alanine N-acetyltransferase [Terriglobales bacterium]|nr:ribosomal protein S18-alanine N-acetyltransferase [Terriglobales bacterium]